MSKYIAAYEKLCPTDPVAKDDSRRAEIIAEMRAVHRAKTTQDAAKAIAWWHWESPAELTRWVSRARKLMGVK